MSQYFLEYEEVLVLNFSQIFLYEDNTTDYDNVLKDFENNFGAWQGKYWKHYWREQGEQRVLNEWYKKYQDYILENNTESKTALYQEGNDLESHVDLWNTLWNKHRESTYAYLYNLFSTIFYQYYVDFKNSFDLVCEEASEDYALEEHDESFVDDFDKLEILGLPTGFGRRLSRARSKRKSNVQENNVIENQTESSSELEEHVEDRSDMKNETESNHLNAVQEKAITKSNKKKKNRNLRNVPKFMLEEKGLLKYWHKRFSLFSRFDQGIRLDRESWFSVTPEKVAAHLAQRLTCDVIVDGFCGCGGNTIQFALFCQKVIAIDIDVEKLKMAKHNAAIYGVAHKIDFILGDFLALATAGQLKADIVFLSPPWGGPKYKNRKTYDIEKFLLPLGASELLTKARYITENIGLFLPRNSNIQQIIKLAGPGNRCEIEHSYLDSRVIGITGLYGGAIIDET